MGVAGDFDPLRLGFELDLLVVGTLIVLQTRKFHVKLHLRAMRYPIQRDRNAARNLPDLHRRTAIRSS